MRLCIVGNSHVAALRLACSGPDAGDFRPSVPSGAGFDLGAIDAFAIPGGYGPALVLDGLRLRPRDPSARVETNVPGAAEQGLDLSVYDQVLFSAAGLPAVRMSFVRHVLVAQAHAGYWRGASAPAPVLVSGGPGAGVGAIDPQPVSQAVLALAIAGALRPMHGLQTLCELARALPGRVTVQPTPLPVRRILQQPDCPLTAWYGEEAGALLSWYWQVQQAEIRRHLSERGLQVRHLPLPDPAWLDCGFSPDLYAEGDDGWHLNADYGRQVLGQWLSAPDGRTVAAAVAPPAN